MFYVKFLDSIDVSFSQEVFFAFYMVQLAFFELSLATSDDCPTRTLLGPYRQTPLCGP